MPLQLSEAALLSTPTPEDLARAVGGVCGRHGAYQGVVCPGCEADRTLRPPAPAKLRWIVQVAYTAAAAPGEMASGTFRWIGRHPDGLPFENRDDARRQALIEMGRPVAAGADLIATVVPLSPPDPMEAPHG